MVDTDAGSAAEPVQVLHWMQTNLMAQNSTTSSDATTFFPLLSTQKPLAPYLAPSPSPGTPHRYPVTLWRQPEDYEVPAAFLAYLPLDPRNLTNRYPFNLTMLTLQSGFGAPVAGNWFDVQKSTGSTGSSSSPTSTGAMGTVSSNRPDTATSNTATSIASRMCVGDGWSVGSFWWIIPAIVTVVLWNRGSWLAATHYIVGTF